MLILSPAAGRCDAVVKQHVSGISVFNVVVEHLKQQTISLLTSILWPVLCQLNNQLPLKASSDRAKLPTCKRQLASSAS